jgi:putative ABC transport system permease protein
MTTATSSPAVHRPPEGGLPARTAVVRWAWRLLRREGRQQILLVTLIAFTGAAAVCGLAAADAYPKSAAGTYGSARQIVRLDAADPSRLPNRLDVARDHMGPIETIGHRSVPVPGSVRPLDLRAQDPRGRFGAAMLRLTGGRYPSDATEIALTRSAATLFHTGMGSTATFDGQQLTVVGLVENPQRLDDDFALAAPGPDAAGRPATFLAVLADASPQAFAAYRQADKAPLTVQERRNFEQSPVKVAVFALATVVLLLVSLVSAAGFAVIAQRRLRQIGMLAAIGATDRHLRLVLIAHGALTGVVAAVIGTAAGIAMWLPVAPAMEEAVGHRIDSTSLPWTLIALMALVAVLAPTAAAWWPARAMARIPAAQALSARPPTPVPAQRSAGAAVVLVAVGAGCLFLAHRTNPLLLSLGIVAVVLGLLLFSPLAVAALARTAGRMPFTPRLALRDLGRYQARSGAALAAIALAVGIPVAVTVLAAANQVTADRGNLAGSQLLIRIGADDSNGPVVPVLASAELTRLRTAVDEYTAALGAQATPLAKAYDAGAPPARDAADGRPVRPVVELSRKTGANSWTAASSLYVATPEAADRFGLDLTAAEPDTDVLTSSAGEFMLTGTEKRGLAAHTRHVPGSSYTAVPRAFLSQDTVARNGWKSLPSGWFVQAPHDLTPAQITEARDMAAANGLVTEVRDSQDNLATLRWAAVAGGALLALGVLAMTIGTIRGEAADELRTLTATGATSAIRRHLAAATAGILALAGVLLGTAGAYFILLAAFSDDLTTLVHVPYAPLALALFGTPALAAATAWLLAGREPAQLNRQLLE